MSYRRYTGKTLTKIIQLGAPALGFMRMLYR